MVSMRLTAWAALSGSCETLQQSVSGNSCGIPPAPEVVSMPSHIRSFRTLLSRFRRNRAGSTVVEFALVAPMFFALLFALIETGIVFFADQMLETGVQDTGRL